MPADLSGRHWAVVRLIEGHPQNDAVAGTEMLADGAFRLRATFKLGLPNAWLADGASPNGVRAVEEVTMTFPLAYPLKAPKIELRSDFDRSLAHVQPGPATQPPRPCIYDGSLTELLHQGGLPTILNQIVSWLERAALGTLINQRQGWEPVRRDELTDVVVADADHLRSLAGRRAGYAAYRFTYLHSRGTGPTATGAFLGQLADDRFAINTTALKRLVTEQPVTGQWSTGASLGIVVWAGYRADGVPFVADRYKPETVTDWASLQLRADEYGCAEPLSNAFSWLGRCLSGESYPGTFPIAIILCARRPLPIIGTESTIELCTYLVEAGCPLLLGTGPPTPVRTAAQLDVVNVSLLRRMAGEGEGEAPPWTLLGCGSLGSKIGLHLARSGRAPSVVVDRGHFRPHNAARHSLLPPTGAAALAWLKGKAADFAAACEGLAQQVKPIESDVIDVTRDATLALDAFPETTWVAVNATASLAVREALAAMPGTMGRPRLIEASLFGEGNVGLLAVEGEAANPNVGDLIAHAYECLRILPEPMRSIVFAIEAAPDRRTIGEGCGSATTAMPDSRISMMAAPMAEAIAALQRNGLPDHGRLLLGRLLEDGLSVAWDARDVAPVTIVTTEPDADGEHVWARIAADATDKITEEIARHPGVETGGVIVGRFSEAARTFHVTDVLPAPEDSVRKPHLFVLGTRGLRPQIAEHSASCNQSLYCLGTWHSHLGRGGPSALDRKTAAAVALARLAPSLLLIHTPAGYQALSAAAEDVRT